MARRQWPAHLHVNRLNDLGVVPCRIWLPGAIFVVDLMACKLCF